MSRRLTDAAAIKLALHMAIDSEDSLIDAYDHMRDTPEGQKAVSAAQKNIDAFRRVLKRYYAEPRSPGEIALDGAKVVTVSIYDLMKGKIPDPDS